MEKIKVVCLGDSITEGYGIEYPGRNYPAWLQEFLGGRYLVYNQGHSGACVTNTELDGRPVGVPYVREPEYYSGLAVRGDIYVILLGTNDAQDGMDDVEDIQNPYDNVILYEAQFEAGFEEILDGVKRAAPQAEIFLCKPAPVIGCIWRCHQEKYLLRLLPHYDHLAAVHQNLHLIDVHAAFTALQRDEAAGLYQDDLLHPNQKGARLIARTVADALARECAFCPENFPMQ